MVEGARLESVYTSQAYRGFESRPVREPWIERRDDRLGPLRPRASALDEVGEEAAEQGVGGAVDVTVGSMRSRTTSSSASRSPRAEPVPGVLSAWLSRAIAASASCDGVAWRR